MLCPAVTTLVVDTSHEVLHASCWYCLSFTSSFFCQGHWRVFLPQSSFSQSVQSLSHVQLFATPWIAARQASLSITNCRSSLKLTSIESVMPSSHLILCRPLLLLPPIPPSITVFSNESTLCMRWPKYWSFSLSISPSNEHPGLIIHYKYMIYAHTTLLGTHEKTGIGKINWHSRILNSSIWLQKSSCRKM